MTKVVMSASTEFEYLQSYVRLGKVVVEDKDTASIPFTDPMPIP